jgi:excisionase family DNA binding protein
MSSANLHLGQRGGVNARLLTVEEAARYVNCTVWCIREWIWCGELPYLQAGRRFLIEVSDLEALIKRLKTTN